ncbi:hypothetical protein AOXY_G21893 [Acipenser oxyrinchus oxyrinchus]|uniref:Uncharacterized protein n=1 Tax=Acipenser oxyrinchus oxyrinchus TaxID=40147 RepID=A0AAD8FZY5_ACIOX|nr:hypothetical protein AOXY_G21893 [Acipenser oxyrinchus oxyrinchus]
MFLEEIIDILQMKYDECSTEKVALVSFTDCKPDVFCKAGIALKDLKCGEGDSVSKLSRALMGYDTKHTASCKVSKEVEIEVEIELRDFLKDLKRCARQQYRHI